MMMDWSKGVLGATIALVAVPAFAQEEGNQQRSAGPEIAMGLFAHGIRAPWREGLPLESQIYEGEEERGTTDVQLVYRSAPLNKALKPRLTARVQLNTGGRTSLASIGAEWRQHILRGRLYGQIGLGLTIHDGYRYTPDPFVDGLSMTEAWQRYDIYARHTSFGSRVLFNPNLSLGVKLNDRWAMEAAYEHFSHKKIFSDQNPGLDTIGFRLVHVFGRKRPS